MTTPVREQPVPAGVPEPLRSWLGQAVSGLWTAVRALASMKLLQGAHLRDVSIANGTTTVFHTLGRPPVGWVVTRQSAALGLYESASQLAARSATTLTLTASAAGTADLWVF